MTLHNDDARLEEWLRQTAAFPGEPLVLTSGATLSYTNQQGERGLQLEISRQMFDDAWLNKVLRLRYLQPAEYNHCIPLPGNKESWLLWSPLPQNQDEPQEDTLRSGVYNLMTLAGLSSTFW